MMIRENRSPQHILHGPHGRGGFICPLQTLVEGTTNLASHPNDSNLDYGDDVESVIHKIEAAVM